MSDMNLVYDLSTNESLLSSMVEKLKVVGSMAGSGGLRGPGGFHIKVTGVFVGFLKLTPKRYQDLVLWAWPQVNFTPKRYQNKT